MQVLAVALLAGTFLFWLPGAEARAQGKSQGAQGLASGAERDAHHPHGHDRHDVEEVVVTGTPLAHERDELAVPVDRFDRQELLDQLGATVGETLSRQPGIATSGFTAGASRPVIRGQDAFRTEVAESGLPTQDVSRESPDHALPINPLAAQRIEVVRGPATLRYGGGATAGVVNVITRRIPDQLAGSSLSGEVFGAVDSVSRRRDLSLVLDGDAGPLAWHVDGLVRHARDYEIPGGGHQPGSFVDAISGSAGASWFVGENARLGASYSRFQSTYGLPEEDANAEIDLHADRVHFEGDWFAPMPGLREMRVRAAYTDYAHDEVVDGETGQTYENNQFDGRLEFIHEKWAGFHGALGLAARFRDFEARGEAAEFMAPSHTTQLAMYLFEERELVHGLVAEFGARIETSRVRGTPLGATSERTEDFLPLSASIGLVLDLRPAWTLGIVGAVSQRAPAETELYARGPHEATETFEIGDPDLHEETAYTGEVRMGFDADRIRADVAAFITHYDDYIYGDLTGASIGGFEELRFTPRDALFYGGEAKVSVELLEAWDGTVGVDAQMDYVRARFTSGTDRNVPRIPPLRWGLGLFYKGDHAQARFGFLRTERQSRVSDNETPTSGFTFVDATVTIGLGAWLPDSSCELLLQATNLLDEKARNVVSFTADEVLLPGRGFRAAIRLPF